MKTIKVNKKGAGKWADPNTGIAQIEVAEDDIVEVSDELADIMCPTSATVVVAELSDEEKGAEVARLAEEALAAKEAEDMRTRLASAEEALETLTADNAALVEERDKLLEANSTAGEDNAALVGERDKLLAVAKEEAATIKGLKAELKAAKKNPPATDKAKAES